MTTIPTTTDPFPDRADAVRTLADEAGWTTLAVRLASMDARGDSFVTGHVVDVVSPDGTALQHTVYLEGALDDDAGVQLESASGERLTAWLYPADPALPALGAAVYPESAAVLLSRLGVDAAGVELAVLSYRAGKRAVIRASVSSEDIYLKIVKPDRVDAIRERHETWRAHGIPVPRVRSWAPDGMLALDALSGVELIGLLDRLPEPEPLVAAVRDLSRRIAGVPSAEKARTSLARRLDWYRGRLAQLAPESAARTHAVCDTIDRTLAAGSRAPHLVTIHGDLHLSQLFAHAEDPARITGVLDIDTAGLGDPADDCAAIVGHLLASADLIERVTGEEAAARARLLAHTFVESWDDDEDRDLSTRAHAIAATHLLGHGLSGSLSATRSLEIAEALLGG